MTLFPETMRLLKEKGAGDILVFGGGIIPKEDMEELSKQGCGRLFGPGTPTTDIVTYLKEKFPDRE
jgi:methylmalonyl-CoA mutase C-terminal domain/subunit